MIIRCSSCRSILVEGNQLRNATRYFEYKMPEGELTNKGLICNVCGRYISEEKINEVIEIWKSSSQK